MSYFQTKVSFLGELENGAVKKITKQFLVDAMSFTETEARVIREIGNTTKDLYFDSIAHSPIQEVVYPSDMTMILWFKCKVVYKDIDEATEKEKKTTIYLLVGACDVNEAYDRCKDHLKEMLVPFEIPKVEETSICEIYQYEKPVPDRYKPTKDNSAEVWASLPEKSKESIKFGINDGHYDEDIQGRFLDETFAVDAIRYGMEKKAFKALIAYVECIIMNKHGHMDDDEGDEDGEY